MENPLNFLSSMLEEVALEGLDGITLTMFWKRLEDRPGFSIAIDEDSKNFLWECIAVHKDMTFYELPEPRPFVPPYNRFNHIDDELGLVVEPLEKLKDPYYPVVPIKDGEIMGSCATYRTRKCVTSVVKNNENLLMSLTQVLKKWGDHLVLVASPKVRLLTLIGTETIPSIDFNVETYCLLERIGRSRYHGEVTQGEDGLLALNTSFCKQLHYYRKRLSNLGLITKQVYYLKNKRGTTTNGCLLHLVRFYVAYTPKMEILWKALIDLLKGKPMNRETCAAARQELGIKESTFKKLFQRSVHKLIEIIHLPYTEFYPNATLKESHTLSGAQKTVKVVQLSKPLEEQKDDENDELEKFSVAPPNVYFDYSKIFHGYPILKQVYDMIVKAGPAGINISDLSRAVSLPRLDIRNVLRALTKKDRIISLLEDRGRQKVTKYFAKMFEKENQTYNVVKEHVMSNSELMLKSKEEPGKRKNQFLEDENCQLSKKKVRFIDEVEVSPAIAEKDAGNVAEKLKEDGKDTSLKTDFENIESQILELYTSDQSSSKSSCTSGSQGKGSLSLIAPHLTYKTIKRTSMILEFLKKVKYTTIGDLQKYLTEQEKQEEYKLCKRSTQRIVCNLAKSKQIKLFKVVLKLNDKKIDFEFICDCSMEPNDPRILLAIEQAKFKHYSVSKEKSKSSYSKNNTEKENIPKEEKVLPMTTSDPEDIPKSAPKFLRAKILHEFLIYLVYYHKAHVLKPDEQCIYHDSFTWKRFVPPLQEYAEDVKEGWCHLSDLITRFPLSIFIKLVNITYSIPNLKLYLNDEEKQHYLIKYLPQDIRNALLNNRKYLFSTYEVIKNLCYMGLASLGPQISSQKDQVFLYVHKNASIKDTTISSPGYIHIEKNIRYDTKLYSFKSLSDVDNYWFDLEYISFNTPLGKYVFCAGETYSMTETAYKIELQDCVRNKKFDEVSDLGKIPGDGLGAGGFDSALYLHIKRNWTHSTTNKCVSIKKDSKVFAKKFTMQNLLKTYSRKSGDQQRLQRLKKLSLPSKKEKTLSKSSEPKNVKKITTSKRQKTKIKTIKHRPRKKRLPFYDDIDKEAMKKLTKSRCDWSPPEDIFLLLCRVASLVLDRKFSKNLVVPHTVVRDLLHEHLPNLSYSKSSRACQRRLRYMMLNQATCTQVAAYLGEVSQDTEFMKEFNVKKPPKTHFEVWKNLFTRVLNKLLLKFTLPSEERGKKLSLPDNLEELNKKYEIIYSQDIIPVEPMYSVPKTVTEIKAFVVNSLVLSVLSQSDSGEHWKYILLQLYKSYPTSILTSVIANLRKNKVIAIKKNLKLSNNVQGLFSHTPYKFSVTYENALLTKFPIKMFKEAHTLLQSFSSLNSETGVELKGDVPAGYASTVLSLASTQQLFIHTEIPEHIIQFDTSLTQEVRSNIVERIIHTLNEKESIELSRILNNEANSLKESTELNEKKLKPNESEDRSSEEDSNYFPRPSNASRYALYLLRQEKTQPPIERTQHSQDYIVLNSCRLFCKMINNENLVLPINPPEVFDNASEITKHIQSNYFAENKSELGDSEISKIYEFLTYYIPPAVLCKSEENLWDTLLELYKNHTVKTFEDARFIFKYIHETGNKGIKEKDIWIENQNLLGDLLWHEHLRLLREANLIIRVGMLDFTYVSILFAEPWLLKSCLWSEKFEKSTCNFCEQNDPLEQEIDCTHKHLSYFDSCEKVYFIPRTWRNPDGSLNKETFFNLLNTVLSHIISSPSISIEDLCKKFHLILQPVQTLELVEVLETAKCIKKYYCQPLKKTSLFSKPQITSITEKPDPYCVEHFENFPDAICKISKLSQALEQFV